MTIDATLTLDAPARRAGFATRLAVLVYAAAAYLFFFTAFGLYFPFFVWDAPVPFTLNGGAPIHPAAALAINVGAILLFGVQHSVMARKSFKRTLTRIIPPAAERATFVLVSTLALLPLILAWSPMPGTLYAISYAPAYWALLALSAAGFGLLLLSSFAINHFELFGLLQAWCFFRKREVTPIPFRQPWLYRVCRHPLMLGILIFLWSTPHLTVGRLVLNLGLTAYILVGLYFEEKDLIAAFGDTYRAYMKATPRLLPRLGRKA